MTTKRWLCILYAVIVVAFLRYIFAYILLFTYILATMDQIQNNVVI